MSELSSNRFLPEPLEGRVLMAGEPWGAFPRLINQDDIISQYPSITGAGQSIAIIDTGVNYKHPALGGGFGSRFKVIGGYDFVDEDSDPIDRDGHGTGIAGIIAAKEFIHNGARYRGLAPDAKIIALRTSADWLSGEEEDLLVERALQWVIDNRTRYNITAINLSQGSGGYSSEVQVGPFWDEMQTLKNAGVFIAASSGNGGVGSPFSIQYPAADPSAFAIGSVNSGDVISRFTERSEHLDLLTPGENVPTTYYVPSTGKHIYVSATGTSFAAPFAAAAAVLLRQVNDELSPDEIMDILVASGSRNLDGDHERGDVTGLTFRRLNIQSAIAMAINNGDDALEQNDSMGSAATLSFSGDFAGAAGLRLMAGDHDFYKFTLSSAARVNFSLGTEAGSRPTFELYTTSGVRLASLGSSHSRELAAGTYILKVSAFSTTIDGEYWIDISRSTLAQPGLIGTASDITFGSDGTLHAVYYDSASRTLRYLTRTTAGIWSNARIVDKGVVGSQHFSLAVDRKGAVGVAYYDAKNHDLKYAQLKGSAFSTTRIDSKGTVGEYPSLAFSNAGKPAISYYSKSGGNLKLAAMGKSKWSITVVDSSGDSGRYSSLALNPKSGLWGIGYVNHSAGTFKFAEKLKSGKWKLHEVEDTRHGGGYLSLAYDRGGRPGMSYFTTDGENLRYAHFDGKKWGKQTVASSGKIGQYSNLIFDSSGAAGVFFYNASADTAVMATASGKRWTLSDIASGGGSYISAASAPNGAKAFLYRDSASGTLRFGVL